MIPEFPMPDEADLLLSKPARPLFSVYSATLLPKSLTTLPSLGLTMTKLPESKIDISLAVRQAKCSHEAQRCLRPVTQTKSSTMHSMVKKMSLFSTQLSSKLLV
ncbi:unnamed protein product, partial [Mesorhabditis belari]|uniref:Uncharacterized protein n=1 Tax=Mesorhabditis belari TaxID=2138241 RepID=A0AAF3FRX8_9BILA